MSSEGTSISLEHVARIWTTSYISQSKFEIKHATLVLMNMYPCCPEIKWIEISRYCTPLVGETALFEPWPELLHPLLLEKEQVEVREKCIFE